MKNQVTIGRVAAFINQKTAFTFEQPTGGMGFFECIDSQQAAFMLFDTCKDWLQKQGMEAMDGPINFGQRDRWWGLLIEGFYPPNYCANYNFLYYKNFFEAYGFQVYFHQYTYYRKFRDKLNDKVQKPAARIKKNTAYTFEHATFKNLDKYAEDFRIIYNQAWTSHEAGIEKLSQIQTNIMIKKMKSVLDIQLLWYIYYNHQPIAFILCLPDVNQYIKGLNGKLNMWGKLQFMYRKFNKKCNKAVAVVFGVIPKFQGKGIESTLADLLYRVGLADQFPYEHLEVNWIGDFNPAMMHLAENIGAKIHKQHSTYRKLFDRHS